MQINWILLFVIFVFFGIMIAIGYWVSAKQKTASDFYVGGRNFGTLTTTATQIASAFGGGIMIAHVGIGYKWGFAEFIYSGVAVPIGVILLAVLAAKWLREQDFYTTTDWMCHRYGDSKTLRVIGSIVASIVSFSWWVAQPIAAAKIMHALTGLPVSLGIIICAIVVIIYTIKGGIIAVAYTDLAQLVLIILGFLVVFPLAIHHAGGFDNIFATVPKENLGFMAPGKEVVWNWLIAIIPAQMVLQIYHQRIYAAKSVKVAKQGLYNLVIAALLMGVWASLLGMAIYTLNPGLQDSEQAIIWLIQNILPEFAAVLVLGAIVAAIVSTADSALHSASASVTRDFYQNIFQPDATDEQVLAFSRKAIMGLGVIGIAVGILFPVLIEIFVIGYTLTTAALVFPLFLGIFWKRATASGAIAGILAGLVVSFVFYINPMEMFPIPAVVLGLAASLVALVSVSLVTKPLPTANLVR